MRARALNSTSVPEWLIQQQRKTLTEFEGQAISHGEAMRRLQLAADLARRFLHSNNNGNQRKQKQ